MGNQLGDIHGNGAAAALIYLAQLAGLPANMLGIQNTAGEAHHLSGGVIGAGLAAGTGVLGHHDAVIDVAGVAALMHLAVDGIEGGVDIGAEAVAVSGTWRTLQPAISARSSMKSLRK